MIRINLLPSERKQKKASAATTGQKMIVGCTLIIVAALGFIGWRYMALSAESTRLDADLLAANQERTRLQSIIKQVHDYEAQKGQLKERVDLIEQLRSAQTGPVHMLDSISRSLPSTVWLTKMTQDPKESKETAGNGVLIEGSTTSQTAVTEFVQNLESTNYFKRSIDIVKSDQGRLTDAKTNLITYDFTIKAIFAAPAAPPPGAKPVPGAKPATSGKTGG
jgi:type IV pilus assembly protein PilN